MIAFYKLSQGKLFYYLLVLSTPSQILDSILLHLFKRYPFPISLMCQENRIRKTNLHSIQWPLMQLISCARWCDKLEALYLFLAECNIQAKCQCVSLGSECDKSWIVMHNALRLLKEDIYYIYCEECDKTSWKRGHFHLS